METTFKGLISMIYSVWKRLDCKPETTLHHCMKLTSEAVHVQKGPFVLLSSTPMFAKNIQIVSSGNDYGSNNVAGGAATGEP